jgi:hypothetical protein
MAMANDSNRKTQPMKEENEKRSGNDNRSVMAALKWRNDEAKLKAIFS